MTRATPRSWRPRSRCATACGRKTSSAASAAKEFLALLPDAGRDAAGVVAESLRASIQAVRARIDGLELAVTVSIGWATWDGEEDADALVKRADGALYVAKRAGRNAVRGAENSSAASLPRRT